MQWGCSSVLPPLLSVIRRLQLTRAASGKQVLPVETQRDHNEQRRWQMNLSGQQREEAATIFWDVFLRRPCEVTTGENN